MALFACLFHSCSEAAIHYLYDVNSIVVELKCITHEVLTYIEILNEHFYYHQYSVTSDSIPALVPGPNFNLSSFYTSVKINYLKIPTYFDFQQIPQTEDCVELFLTIAKSVKYYNGNMCFFLTAHDVCKPKKMYSAAYLVYKGKIVVQMVPQIDQLKYFSNCQLSEAIFEAVVGEKLSANQHFTVQFMFVNGVVSTNSSLHLRVVDAADSDTPVDTLGYLKGISTGVMKVTEGAFILQLGQESQVYFPAGAEITLFVYKDAVESGFTVVLPATATRVIDSEAFSCAPQDEAMVGATGYNNSQYDTAFISAGTQRFVVFDDIEGYWRMLLEDPKMQIDKAISVAETTDGLWAFMLDVNALKIRHIAVKINHRKMEVLINHTKNAYLETWEMSLIIHESRYYLTDYTSFDECSRFYLELSADDDVWIRSQRFPRIYVIDHDHRITIDDVYMRTFEYQYVYYAIIAATCVYALVLAVKA